MSDYNKMLIDLLNEKISTLYLERAEQKKEINRLKRKIRLMEKERSEDNKSG